MVGNPEWLRILTESRLSDILPVPAVPFPGLPLNRYRVRLPQFGRCQSALRGHRVPGLLN